MTFSFFGVHFQDINNIEYRRGFYDDNHYMQIIESKDSNTWVEDNQQHGIGAAGEICRDIRNQLSVTIPFFAGHKQNERS